MRKNRERGFIYGLIVLGLVTSLVGLTDQARAQSTANGPYYATPSWDQTLPAATRFVVLSNFNNEAVLDRNTGLVWEKSPRSQLASWPFAKDVCLNRITGNQMGWRLPSVTELASLLDPTALTSGPKLQSGHPFDNIIESGFYWSATSDAGDSLSAYGVGLTGLVVNSIPKDTGGHFWCVRGGMNSSQY